MDCTTSLFCPNMPIRVDLFLVIWIDLNNIEINMLHELEIF
jgi:hypothetical protein